MRSKVYDDHELLAWTMRQQIDMSQVRLWYQKMMKDGSTNVEKVNDREEIEENGDGGNKGTVELRISHPQV